MLTRQELLPSGKVDANSALHDLRMVADCTLEFRERAWKAVYNSWLEKGWVEFANSLGKTYNTDLPQFGMLEH